MIDFERIITELYDGPIRAQAKEIVNSFLLRDTYAPGEREKLLAWIEVAPLREIVDSIIDPV